MAISARVVVTGQTLGTIAQRLGVDAAQLTALNPGVEARDVVARGSLLRVPRNAPGLALQQPATPDIRRAFGGAASDGVRQGAVPRLDINAFSFVRIDDIRALQRSLQAAGFYPAHGAINGNYGIVTRAAVRRAQEHFGLAVDERRPGEALFNRLNEANQAAIAVTPESTGPHTAGPLRFPPGSPQLTNLFRQSIDLLASRGVHIPAAWAESSALHWLVDQESDGIVGRLNYTYGARANDPSTWDDVHAELRAGQITAESSATGIGQLLSRNAAVYYPAGLAGIGDPVQEAAGMLCYILDRYGTPEYARECYNQLHEGY